MIVKYKSGAAAKSKTAAADRAGLTKVLGAVEATGAEVVEVADAKAAAAVLNRSATVEYAEPNLELKAFGVPDDARFGELYGLDNANDADMDPPEGWDLAGYPNLPATTVGIVDTGVDNAHDGLAGKTVACASVRLLTNRVREGSCNDDNDHGTHVAGVSYNSTSRSARP